MSVAKLFLERVETLGLLDEKVLGQLRKQVADAKGPVTAETLAKVLVDNGHLTVFQAKKLVGDVTAAIEEARQKAAAKPASAPAAPPSARPPVDELTLLDDEGGLEILEDEPAPAPLATLGADDLEILDDSNDLEILDDSDGLELLPDDPPAKPVAPVKPTAKTASAPPPNKVSNLTATAKAKTSTPGAPAGVTSASKPVNAKPASTTSKPPSPPKTSMPSAAKPTKPTPSAPKPSPTPVSETLTPLGDDDLEVLDEGLTPLDDVLGGDALLGPAEAASPLASPQKPGKPLVPRATKNKNPWDSTLIYVGGGGLLVLVFAFVVLYVSLSRGSANDAFQLAEEDFKAQGYEQAISKYEHYLSRYGDSDSNASLARVRVGVAQIRMAVDHSKNTADALAVTKETIERIEKEERFDEARAELADVLPAIAEKLALQAKRSVTDVKHAAVLAGHAEEALRLITSYIPPAMRQPMETKVTGIQEDIAAVKREINQDQELQAAVKAMNEATVAAQTTTATQLRSAFLKRYPGLARNEQIMAATLAIAKKEQELVSIVKETLSPTPTTPSPVVEIALSDHSAATDTAGPANIIAIHLQGSVFGVDASAGRIAWRSYLGLETTGQPVPITNHPGADVLVIDKKRHALLRLVNGDGAIAWRLTLGEPFAAPVIVGGKALVSTAAGRLVEVDLETGTSNRQAALPQGAVQSIAFDGRRPHIYQLGEHSNLFVLSSESLECREVYFLGHSPGGIAAPPVATGGQVFICENAGADYSLVHILSGDAEGRNLERKVDPVRLKGRVVTAPLIDGQRVYVFTDLGAIQVFHVDPANISQPVTSFTGVVPVRKEPLVSFAAVDKGRVWVGDERMTLYELQPAKKELTRKWSRFEGEVFLAPPLMAGNGLLVARLRRNVHDVAISAVTPNDGSSQWRANVAAPVRAIFAGADRPLAINANATAFSFATGNSSIAEPAARLAVAGDPPTFSLAWTLDDKILLAPRNGAAQWGLVAVAMSPPKTAVVKAATNASLVAPPINFEGGVLLPLDNGQVVLANPLSGKPMLLPFQPPLTPGKMPVWQVPLALRGIPATFAIADDMGHLYLGARQEEAQPHLAVKKQVSAGAIRGPLAQLDGAVLAVVEKEGKSVLQPFTLPDLSPGEPLALSSGVSFGPRSAGAGVLLATDRDGLMMLDPNLKTHWELPLEGAGIAGIGMLPNALIAITSQGEVLQIDQGGQVNGRFASERPLAGDPTLIGDTLWCPGADGAVYGIPLSSLSE